MKSRWIVLSLFVLVTAFPFDQGHASHYGNDIQITSFTIAPTHQDNPLCSEGYKFTWTVETDPPNLDYFWFISINGELLAGDWSSWTSEAFFFPGYGTDCGDIYRYGAGPYEVKFTAEIYTLDGTGVIADSVSETIQGDQGSAKLVVYPSEQYIDKGEVFLHYWPNVKVFLEIPKGSSGIEFLHSAINSTQTWITTDATGEGKATVKYTFQSIEDMRNSATPRILAYFNDQGGYYGTLIAECIINVAFNWEKLIADYKNAQRCPGARGNPCTVWFQEVTSDWGPTQLLNGVANNLFAEIGRIKPIPSYTYPGQELFTCGEYQDRIMSWFFQKRNHANKTIAAQVNGIECFPYTMGGVHKFVGIFPAGISNEYKKVAACGWARENPMHLFLDPWFLQHGPEVLTDSEMILRMRDIPVLLGIGVGLISPTIGIGVALGRVGLSVCQTSPHANGAYDYLQAIADIPAGTIRFDLDYRNTIDIDKGIFINVQLITNQPHDFQDPECPTEINLKKAGKEFSEEIKDQRDKLEREIWSLGAGVLLYLMCPVSATITNESGDSFEFDHLSGEFSGNLPIIGISMLKEDNTHTLAFIIFDEQFFVDITAEDTGELTVYLVNPEETSMASYEGINLRQNDKYTLNMANADTFPPLSGPDGVTISPQVFEMPASAPTSTGGDGGGGGGCFISAITK